METPKKKTETRAALSGIKIEHDRQLPRLSRIEGQVRGLQKMIDTKRHPLDIVHQISAVISALRRVQSDMVRDPMAALGEAIFTEKLSPQKRREITDEIATLLKRLS